MNQSFFKTIIISIFILIQHNNILASEWSKPKDDQPKLFNVQVMDSLATIINDSIDFSSTTEASRRIEIKSEIMTTIDKVLIKAGTLVKKGQHVIKLDEFDPRFYKDDNNSNTPAKKVCGASVSAHAKYGFGNL